MSWISFLLKTKLEGKSVIPGMSTVFLIGCPPRICLAFGSSVFLITFEGFVVTLIGLGLGIGDFNDILEVKLSVETELSLDDESDLLLVSPGLSINFVGTIFFFTGDNGAFDVDNEEVLFFIVGDNRVVFMTGESGDFIEDVDEGFVTTSDCVFSIGDLGTKFLETIEVLTLTFKFVVFKTGEVDNIVEGNLADSNDKVLDSFLTITFGEIDPDLEITLDLLLTIEFVDNDIFILGSLVIIFEGEEGVFEEIDLMLEAVDGLLDINGDLLVGIVDGLIPTIPFVDNAETAVFFTGVIGFATIACCVFDESNFNNEELSLAVVLETVDFMIEVEGLVDNDIFEVVVVVLDIVDMREDLVTREDTTDKADACEDTVTDFDVEEKFSFAESVVIVEDLIPGITGDFIVGEDTDNLVIGDEGNFTAKGDLVADTDLFTVGVFGNERDFTVDDVGVLGIDLEIDGKFNSLASIAFILSLSGGGLFTDFLRALVTEEIDVFVGSNLASITSLVAGLEVGLFRGIDSFFTEVAIGDPPLFFSEALLTGNPLTEDPDINFIDAFRGDPGDPGDKVFDPEPVLEIVIGPDFFTTAGNVMLFYNKII